MTNRLGREREAASDAELLAALARRGAPQVARLSHSPFDEGMLFEIIRRAGALQRRHSRRKYLVGLERLLQRFPEAARSPDWSCGPGTSKPGQSFEFIGYRDGATLIDASPYLPSDAHASFAAYTAYLEGLGASLGFQAPGIEALSQDLAVGLRFLIKRLIKPSELRKSYLNAFFGNYRSTPFGVHVDPHHEHAFHLVLSGSKELWCWDAFELAKLAEPSQVLGGVPPSGDYPLQPLRLATGPGQVVYWPGHFAHSMVTQGPSLGVSIVLEPPEASPEQAFLSIGLADCQDTAALRLRSVARVAPRGIDDAIAIARARCRSIGGLIGVGPLTELDAAGCVSGTVESRIDPEFPIEVLDLSDGELAVIANGHHFEWNDPASAHDLRRLLDYLNGFTSSSVSQLLERFVSARLAQSDVLALLRFCAAAAAIRPSAAG